MNHPAVPSCRAEFWSGAKDTVPLIVGAIPFGIIFGALAVNSGVSPAGTLGMSAFVFAGSAQFIAAGLVAGGTGGAIVVLTTFVVNLRHMLYSASLAPYVKHLPQRWLLPLGFWLTDETYAVVITRYRRHDHSPHKHWYHLGSAVAMYANWQLCTCAGLWAGQAIPDPGRWGLEFAMVVTFIGMVITQLAAATGRTDRAAKTAAVVVAGSSALLANPLPNRLGLMVGALAGILAGLGVEMLMNRLQPERRKLTVASYE